MFVNRKEVSLSDSNLWRQAPFQMILQYFCLSVFLTLLFAQTGCGKKEEAVMPSVVPESTSGMAEAVKAAAFAAEEAGRKASSKPADADITGAAASAAKATTGLTERPVVKKPPSVEDPR